MSFVKKSPERTCIVCRQTKEKRDLIRIVRTTSGEFAVDRTGKVNGRGAYICNTAACAEKCKKTRALNKSFKCEIPLEVYDRLAEEIDK